MSSSLYLPGLEDSLRTALGESRPSLAFVPVLDLPDSQILHLSCWLSVWKSMQGFDGLHSRAGTHWGFSRTWKSLAPASMMSQEDIGTERKPQKLQNCLRAVRTTLAFSQFHVGSRNVTLRPDGVAAVVEDSAPGTFTYRTTDRRMSREETRVASSRRVIKCIPLRSRCLWWNSS